MGTRDVKFFILLHGHGCDRLMKDFVKKLRTYLCREVYKSEKILFSITTHFQKSIHHCIL